MSYLPTPRRVALCLRAAAHELNCWECRVTWLSWLQRLLFIPAGMRPRPRNRPAFQNTEPCWDADEYRVVAWTRDGVPLVLTPHGLKKATLPLWATSFPAPRKGDVE